MIVPKQMDDRPWIALTMGDPAGVGPELCLRALSDAAIHRLARLAVFGDWAILDRCRRTLGWGMPKVGIRDAMFGDSPLLETHAAGVIVQTGEPLPDSFQPGVVSADTGTRSAAYLDAAIAAARAGWVHAITTAPINKDAWDRAGVSFPGHTEFLAERFGVRRWTMLQYAEDLACSFVTTHVGHQKAIDGMTKERIVEVIQLSVDGLRRIRKRDPHVIVCGLNPHAGEGGLFGNREEERLIQPAIESVRKSGVSIEGPLPADTAFIPQNRERADVYVCMYHDQGHIPIKALAFDRAVNTTLGLPTPRTSVDHGTALDIAWKGKANPGSLFAALRLAARLIA